jgi:hypothetical protein
VSATITRRMRDRLAAPVVVIYWVALIVGLVVYSTARIDADDLGALWAGALGGTALGQGLALRDVRGWFAAAIVGMAALVFAPMLAVGGAPAALWQALLPAVVCGYWSLGERTAPAAFWFPAMTWMLTVVDRLDGDDAAATMDARAFVLLGGVAAAFLALLWAAEKRRLGLLRAVGSAPVVPGRAATLREPAGRTIARAGWWAAVAALTLGLTAWVAPHLWQSETLGGQQLTEFADGVGVGDRDGVPCCPLVSAEAPRVRVREFLDVAHGVQRPPARVGVNCVACDRGWGLVAGGGYGVATATNAPTVPTLPTHAPGDVAPLPPMTDAPVAHEVVPTPPAPTVAHEAETPPTVPSEPSHANEAPPVAPSPSNDPPHSHPSASPQMAAAMRPAPRRQPADASALIRLLLTLLVAAAAFVTATLTLRPLRRAITLRHLRTPYWAETLEQRVSNLWQLTLVGLRDAGFCARAGEQPEELARRVRVDGVGDCAQVLERARHGLGLDDGDLAAMAEAAELAYRAARTRLSVLARAAAAVRWPLA